MVCPVPGCRSDRIIARGWCEKHYRRWKRHGNPLGGRTQLGVPEQYLNEVVLKYDGDECLPWHYAVGGNGYAQVWRDGRYQLVSRIVCEEVHGPAPTPDHDAAHSCGRGNHACVTKRHLSWKTKVGNMADQLIHGTRIRGEKHPFAKLSTAQVLEIRSLSHVKQRDLATRYGVSTTLICAILKGRKWGWLHADQPEGFAL